METKELGGKQIEVDEDGFIQDPDAWDQAVAKIQAAVSTGRGEAAQRP